KKKQLLNRKSIFLMYKMKKIKFTLKNLRKKNNFTQAIIAEKLGISIRAYAKIESGETNLTIERLHKLSTIFNMDITEFLEYETNKLETTNDPNTHITLLKHYEETIVLLKEQNEMLRKIIFKQYEC